MPSPSGLKSARTLKPSTQGIERTKMPIPQIMHVLILLRPVISCTQDIMFWNTAKIVDIAAKVINRKNRLPQSEPSGIFINTLGRVTNIRFGPASTSIL